MTDAMSALRVPRVGLRAVQNSRIAQREFRPKKRTVLRDAPKSKSPPEKTGFASSILPGYANAAL